MNLNGHRFLIRAGVIREVIAAARACAAPRVETRTGPRQLAAPTVTVPATPQPMSGGWTCRRGGDACGVWHPSEEAARAHALLLEAHHGG